VLPATVLPTETDEVENPEHTDPITFELVSVIAPVCPFNDVTPPAGGAAEVQVDPFDVSKLPFEPGATKATADVPLPRMTLFAVKVLVPVPPSATTRGVVKSIEGEVIPLVPSMVTAMFYS
jgi:hypothetical protein